ncbi:MAG: hypothetical protein U0451_02435 [Candidatus Saccharimonadales bacterium]
MPGSDRLNDEQAESFERLQNMTLGQIEEEMPSPRWSFYPEYADGLSIRYVDLRAPDEGSSKKAVLNLFPFGNEYTPAMHIRAKLLQETLPEDTRLLLFPNNTDERFYSFNRLGQNDAIDELGNMVLAACTRLGVEEVSVVGYSQGASVGASILRQAYNYDIDTKAAYLGDPADVVNRTPKELKKAFVAGGLSAISALNRAINDSGIPALTEAQLSGGGIDRVRQLIRFAGLNKVAKVHENELLHESMARDSFVDNIVVAVHDVEGTIDRRDVSVVRMGDSLVCTEDLEQDMESKGLTESLTVVEGYGHEGGDNVLDSAVRASQVIAGSDFYKI